MPENKAIKKNNGHETAKDFSALLKERDGDGPINQNLKKIYQSETADAVKSGGMPARRRIDPWQRLALTFLVFLALLAAVSWSGFYLLHQGDRLRSEDVTVQITGPSETTAGKEEVYEIL